MAAPLLTIWRVVLAATAFLVAAGKSLVDLGIFNSKPGYGSWVIIGGSLVVLIDAVGRILLAGRASKKRRLHDDTMKITLSTMKTVAELSGLDIWSLGGSVFVPRRAGLLWRQRTLLRIARQRLSDSPAATMVRWLPGKGIVGKVWQEKRFLYVSWKSIAERYPSEGLTEENYKNVPEEHRSGFTFDEFRGIVDKYAEVMAVPIWNPGRSEVIGVLSIDVAMTDTHPSLGTCLRNQRAREAAERGAALLSDVVGKR